MPRCHNIKTSHYYQGQDKVTSKDEEGSYDWEATNREVSSEVLVIPCPGQ